MAIGAATGFTGSTKPLEAYERGLLGATSRAKTQMQGELQSRLQQMARAAGVRMPNAGELRAQRERARDEGRRRV